MVVVANEVVLLVSVVLLVEAVVLNVVLNAVVVSNTVEVVLHTTDMGITNVLLYLCHHLYQ